MIRITNELLMKDFKNICYSIINLIYIYNKIYKIFPIIYIVNSYILVTPTKKYIGIILGKKIFGSQRLPHFRILRARPLFRGDIILGRSLFSGK